MSAPAAMTLPGGRVVLGWWRDLAGLAPRRLWYAHLLLHHVEALVEATVAPHPLVPLADALLAWLGGQPGPVPAERLAADLVVEGELLRDVLAELEARGLARQDSAGWQPTEAGRQPPSSSGPAAARQLERRSFCFTDGQPPLFVPLAPGAAQTLTSPPAFTFDLAVLEACIRESEAWKTRHGFPLDVRRLIRPGPDEDWRAVAVDRAAQALLVLVEVAGASGADLLGFAVRSDGWALGREPVLTWPGGAEQLEMLGGEAGPEAWRQAWQLWCQQRSLPGGEVEACRLDVVDHRLRVQAPPRLVERLRAARSDALKGEAWLLAGAGRVRPAVMIDLGEG
jgi:hypothetical protein